MFHLIKAGTPGVLQFINKMQEHTPYTVDYKTYSNNKLVSSSDTAMTYTGIYGIATALMSSVLQISLADIVETSTVVLVKCVCYAVTLKARIWLVRKRRADCVRSAVPISISLDTECLLQLPDTVAYTIWYRQGTVCSIGEGIHAACTYELHRHRQHNTTYTHITQVRPMGQPQFHVESEGLCQSTYFFGWI